MGSNGCVHPTQYQYRFSVSENDDGGPPLTTLDEGKRLERAKVVKLAGARGICQGTSFSEHIPGIFLVFLLSNQHFHISFQSSFYKYHHTTLG